MTRYPRVDEKNESYEDFKRTYDDINEVEEKVDNILPKSYTRIPQKDEGKISELRIVHDSGNIYLYIKTTAGWKQTQLT